MRGNFTFRNEEDAQQLIESCGGHLNDNRHNVRESAENQFTVSITENNERVDHSNDYEIEDDDE